MIDTNPSDFTILPAFGRLVCEPAWHWPPREKPLENYDLFYVSQGDGTVVLNGRAVSVTRGSCFLFRPGDWTSASHNAKRPLHLTYVHFKMTHPVSTIPESYRTVDDAITLEALLARLIRVLLTETFAAHVEAQLVLKQIMLVLLRQDQLRFEGFSDHHPHHSQSLRDTIYEIAHYVVGHPAEPHTIDFLAARAQMSGRTLSVRFREIMGQPLRSFIIQAKIQRAEHLLHYTGMNVSEVAALLGYDDVAYFSRQFKRVRGKSPSDVRC